MSPVIVPAKKFHWRSVRTVRGDLAYFRAAAPVFQATQGKANITAPNGWRTIRRGLIMLRSAWGGAKSEVRLPRRQTLLAVIPWVN